MVGAVTPQRCVPEPSVRRASGQIRPFSYRSTIAWLKATSLVVSGAVLASEPVSAFPFRTVQAVFQHTAHRWSSSHGYAAPG